MTAKSMMFVAVALAAALSAGCGGGSGDSSAEGANSETAAAQSVGIATTGSAAGISVTGLVLKAERRISRTVFEYDYQIVVKNDGAAHTGLMVQLTAVGAGTTIVDGAVAAGAIAAGTTVTPIDIIRLHHDRSLPFQPTALVWKFTADLGPLLALPGNPADQAVDVISEYDADTTFDSTALEFDLSRGATVLRSKVIFGFKPGTTVGQINTLLQSMNAIVVRTYDKTAVIEAKIQDPGSLAALNVVLAALRSNPIVRYALPSSHRPVSALPASFVGVPESSLDIIAHHLAVRAAPAWNARRAVILGGARLGPILLILDRFGGGAPNPGDGLLDTAYIGSVGTGFTSTQPPSHHGYHVLGIAAASFNSSADLADSNFISGLYAAVKPVLLEIDDLNLTQQQCTAPVLLPFLGKCKGKSDEDRIRAMLLAYLQVDRKLVVNTSLSYNQPTSNISNDDAEAAKLYWLQVVRGGFGEKPSPLEEKFFHAAAAGNNPLMPARQGGGWERAAIDKALANTAVVENRSASARAPFAASIIHWSSSFGGNISAIGSNTNPQVADQGVWSYRDAAGNLLRDVGTSMAAPQVAGLAASFWAIRSDVTSSQLLKLIQDHATPFAGGGAPLIDAYATLLAADRTSAIQGAMGNPMAAPVRLAILDVDENDKFDFKDADIFAAALHVGKGGSAYDISSPRTNWITIGGKPVHRSRFDLNGDGFIGGTGAARFNLDIDYEDGFKSNYSTASFTMSDGAIVDIHESIASDLQILCYYVHSKLWRDSSATADDFEKHIRKEYGLSCAFGWNLVSDSGGSENINSRAFGVYGTKGVPSTNNRPGAREGATTWTDRDGSFWLFGGHGLGASCENCFGGFLNDLWKFNPTDRTWTWVSGSKITEDFGQRVLHTNSPSPRVYASSWIDANGNLWLFGGNDPYGTSNKNNELWKFSPTTGVWVLVSGSGGTETTPLAFGVYGTKGIPSVNNYPGAREGATTWTDRDGSFWLFGGHGLGASCENCFGGFLNDLWKFNPRDSTWTWVSGSSTADSFNAPVSNVNLPSSRHNGSSWIDPHGNLWLFGGRDPYGVSNKRSDLWVYQR